MSASAPSPVYKIGVVKQVLSGDTVIIRRQPKGGPPPEKVIALSGITAPKLARQRTANNDSETKDEPFAWEAREFLRKKLVGKEVIFTAEKPPNSATREYGSVWAGKDPTKDENMTEALLAEGLAKVRDGGRNIPQLKRLVEIEDTAKSQGKGIWGNDCQEHVRDIKWSVENPKQLVSKLNGQPVKAIIEYVRDGSTVRLCLLPDYTTITLMLSGIRCPTMMRQDTGEAEPYAEEARFFLESKLLHKDVEVILEAVNNNNNNNFVGTILHPQGNIAEALVRQGFARCVDWSLAVMKSGATTLRAAERAAKDARLRIWTNYTSNAPVIAAKDKEFTATVMEVVNGDALVVKLPNNTLKKIFLASIRPPREKNSGDEENKQSPRPKGFKPLYDIPWMFEAREYLRKLVGKKVSVTVDYIQPAKDNFPEKTCCTVLASGTNVAEVLVSKGYATVVRYRNDNDQRSSQYHSLLEAENKAQKANVGVHAKKDIPVHRIQDTSGDSAKAKKFFPFLKRAQKTEAIVEFVASGSRMRLYIPKESVLVTFLLAGVNCPRGARPAVGGAPGMQDAEPFGEEALHFTKDKCLQHDVVVTIEEMDKAGNFIGWLWVENENLSVALVEHGLATTHHTAETSEYARLIKTAEENALKRRIGLWKNYVEVEKEAEIERNNIKQDRTVKYEKVIITEITADGHFYTQNVDHGAKLESLMEKIHQEFKNNAPLPGSYVPRRGQICAARFALDNQWYRAKVEKIADDKTVHIFYIDYGNREVVDVTRLAALPAGTETEPPYVTEYVLCCTKFPDDPDDRSEAVAAFSTDTLNKKLLLNVETRGSPASVTLVDPNNNVDLAKNLIKEGLVLVDCFREARLTGLITEYRAAQEHAKSARLNLWRHGDITDDDAQEFGARR